MDSLKPHIRLTPLYIFLVVQTIVWSVISIILFLVEPSGRLAHRYGARLWAKILLWGSRVSVELRGQEQLAQTSGPLVLVTNHSSMYDILALLAGLNIDFKFVVKKELRKVPLWGYAMEKAGYLFIDRADSGQTLEIIRSAARKIREGSSVLFFAEGTRSADGSLGQFKRGAFTLASKSGCDVAPIAIKGAYEVLPKGSLLIRPGRITLTILPPVVDPALKKNSKLLMAAVRERLLEGLGQTGDREVSP